MAQLVEYLANNHDKLLFLIAGISLVIELGVMGMSGPLLFFAIACALTGILVTIGLVNSLEMEILAVGVISLVTALLLWQPLQRLQGKGKQITDTSSDLIGKVVPVSADITAVAGHIRYSGIDWHARLDKHSDLSVIPSGQQVEIVTVDGTVLIVVPHP